MAYYEAFHFIGSFISGQDSIIAKWAEFSWTAAENRLNDKSIIIKKLLDGPITERDTNSSRQFFENIFKETGAITCIWTGHTINQTQNFDIDHLMPFSIMRNNDLWNLLPTKSIVNKQKSNRVPTPARLQEIKNRLFTYWDLLYQHNDIKFAKEIEQALLGQPLSNKWQELALHKLKEQSGYLIEDRCYEPW